MMCSMPARRRVVSKSRRKNDVSIPPTESGRLIAHYLEHYPTLRSPIIQSFLIRLHSQGYATLDEIYLAALGSSVFRREIRHRVALNIDTAVEWNQKQRNALQKTVIAYASRHFTPEEIHDLVGVTAKREEARQLGDIAGLPGVSFEVLKRQLDDFCQLPLTAIALPPSDAVATRVALMRQLVSDRTDFLKIARDFITIRELHDLTGRMIGPRRGIGRIGGKAAGLVLAHKILKDHYRKTGREPLMPIAVPESYYLRSDLNDEFVRRNGLKGYSSQKYKSQEAIEADYPLIRELFHAGTFPPEVVTKVRKLLEQWGPVPLIVRSSSLLEDDLGAAFSGKYRSIFLANQGPLADRTRRFLSAVAEVYSCIYAADPLLYRREKNLLDYDEFMAILIQRVVGGRFGHFFYPLYAGVAFSRNEYYRWNRRIRREDGFVRVVAGIGTRAVDRVSSDYPRMIALTVPTLRPQGSVGEIVRQSQKSMDVLNLRENRFETLLVKEVLKSEIPSRVDLLASIVDGESLMPAVGTLIDPSSQEICLTFDKLVESTPFAPHIREVLSALEEGYGCPVDIEFASDGTAFYLLQCRPLAKLMEMERVTLPTEVDPQDVLFRARRDIRNAVVKNIEYIIYVPTAEYDAIEALEAKQTIGRVVGQLNRKLEGKSFILMGPGRWGSNDINLGVRVNYADIRNTRALIEVAHEKNGYVPEVSFGTHFFQALVESSIVYLPLYPEAEGSDFKSGFFRSSQNSLRAILPDRGKFEPNVRVIHVPTLAAGRYAHLVMDGEREEAICYLA